MTLSNSIHKNNFRFLAFLGHPDEITEIELLSQQIPEPTSSEVFRNSCLVCYSGTGPSKGWQHQADELQSRCVQMRAEANAEQNDFVLAAYLTLTLLCTTQLQHQSSFRHTELLFFPKVTYKKTVGIMENSSFQQLFLKLEASTLSAVLKGPEVGWSNIVWQQFSLRVAEAAALTSEDSLRLLQDW